MSSNEKGNNYSGFGYKTPYVNSSGYFAFPVRLIQKNMDKVNEDAKKRPRIEDPEEKDDWNFQEEYKNDSLC